jgi:subtilisin family serine protease
MDAIAALSLSVVRPLGGLPRAWVLEAPDPRAAVAACRELFLGGEAEWAVPDFLLPPSLHFRPGDPLYPTQWHLSGGPQQAIAAEEAWDLTLGEPSVVAAVVDTGVDPSHPDLDPARMISPRNALSDGGDPSPSPLSIDAHGTACMGLIAASAGNAEGCAGVCPGCGWMPVRVFEDGGYMNHSALVEGIVWAADHGASVISNSWGIGQELIDQGVDVTPVKDAVRHAVSTGRGGKGCVVLFAAGNGDGNLNAQPIGPDELPAMDETIAVGGCDETGAPARYSDFGSCVSVVAPTWSGNAGTLKITTLDSRGDAGANKGGAHYRTESGQGDVPSGEPEPDTAGNYTRHFTGTSAATPIAAGVAALVLSANPDLTWREVKDILQATADKVPDPSSYGPDGHSERLGYGRVNAFRAVALARFGRDMPAGSPCRIPENCAGDCLSTPLRGTGPACFTPCAPPSDCPADQVCEAGHCYPEVVLTGGCGCAASTSVSASGSGTAGTLAALIFMKRRRRIMASGLSTNAEPRAPASSPTDLPAV